MSSDKGSASIRRNRPPRVQIAYKDPHDSQRNLDLAFVMGVMADLSGNDPGREKQEVAEREFDRIESGGLDTYMRQEVQPGVTFTVQDTLSDGEDKQLGVKLRFNSMKDFEPAQVARQVPSLKKLMETRQNLAQLKTYLTSNPKAQDQIKELLEDPEKLAVLAAQAAQQQAAEKAAHESAGTSDDISEDD